MSISLRVSPQAGMAVPSTPSRMASKNSAGFSPRMNSTSVKSAAPASPEPSPASPWQDSTVGRIDRLAPHRRGHLWWERAFLRTRRGSAAAGGRVGSSAATSVGRRRLGGSTVGSGVAPQAASIRPPPAVQRTIHTIGIFLAFMIVLLSNPGPSAGRFSLSSSQVARNTSGSVSRRGSSAQSVPTMASRSTLQTPTHATAVARFPGRVALQRGAEPAVRCAIPDLVQGCLEGIAQDQPRIVVGGKGRKQQGKTLPLAVIYIRDDGPAAPGPGPRVAVGRQQALTRRGGTRSAENDAQLSASVSASSSYVSSAACMARKRDCSCWASPWP